MAIANVRMYLSEAELWRAVTMVKQGARQGEVGEVFGVDHMVITQASNSMVHL
jgi:hypothetical protein